MQDVFSKHVAFEVHAVPNVGVPQVRMLQSVRYQLDVETVGTQLGDGQADPVNSNRPFWHDQGPHAGRKRDREPLELRYLADVLDGTHRVDMSQDEMTTESTIRAKRPLEIHQAPWLECAQRGHADGLRPDIGVDLAIIRENDRQADTADRQTVARLQLVREPRLNPEPESGAGWLPLHELADRFNEAGKHILQS